MIIKLGYYKRKAGLTHAEFSAHWTNIHGPLIRQIPDIDRHLIRYVQHHLTPEPGVEVPPGMDFDGFSEAWFADQAACDAVFADPFFQSAVIEDEAKFIDMAATRWYVVDEQRTIIKGPAGLV